MSGRDDEELEHQWLALGEFVSTWLASRAHGRLAFIFCISAMNSETCHHNIVDDGKNTFTVDPVTVPVLDSEVLQYRCLLKLDSMVIDMASLQDLVWMEIIEARCSLDFIERVAQDIYNRVGGEQNIGIGSKV